MGLERKFADGGTIGPTRIGYMNVREQVNDKEVRSVALDEGPLPVHSACLRRVRHGRALGHDAARHARGSRVAYSSDRQTAGQAAEPQRRPSDAQDDYYLGIVSYKGLKREGRHPAIIDPATFEKVQRALESNLCRASARKSTSTTSRARSSAGSAAEGSSTDAIAATAAYTNTSVASAIRLADRPVAHTTSRWTLSNGRSRATTAACS